jgi:predicted nucleic acid-binding protein
MVLLDANVLVYYLDETAEKNIEMVRHLQQLVDGQEQLVTSHHVIEEVLFTLSKTRVSHFKHVTEQPAPAGCSVL